MRKMHVYMHQYNIGQNIYNWDDLTYFANCKIRGTYFIKPPSISQLI